MKPFLKSLTLFALCWCQMTVHAADKDAVLTKISTLNNAVSRNSISFSDLDRIESLLSSAIQIANQQSVGDPSSCFSKAYNILYNQDKAQDLCAGGGTTQTVDCYQDAYNTMYSTDKSILLCKNGGNVATSNCYKKAYYDIYDSDKA
ncbi:MAG: hypothetical protein IPK04_06620, partial [Bdellovibrionales bacterium]|nr:hypothetical protein [Bdellovibrionales bacterium]